jgi:hypothetical protein
VPGCWACKVASVNLAPSAMPSRAPEAADVKAREARWEKDRPAYKRLRENGQQPRCIDGCAELEAKAVSPADIELGLTNVPASHRSQVDDVVALNREMGVPA